MTDDLDIRHRISTLVSEEHALREQLADRTITASDEHARLEAVEAELDQCWDLLRQRDARRSAGQSPDGAEVRSARVVEGYQS